VIETDTAAVDSDELDASVVVDDVSGGVVDDASPVASSTGTHWPLNVPECAPYRRPDSHAVSGKLHTPCDSQKPPAHASSSAQ
jgi:hypothetical protein